MTTHTYDPDDVDENVVDFDEAPAPRPAPRKKKAVRHPVPVFPKVSNDVPAEFDDDGLDFEDNETIEVSAPIVRTGESIGARAAKSHIEKQALLAEAKALQEDLTALAQAFDYGEGRHSIRVYREEPKMWNGQKCSGHVDTYHHAVTIEEIKEKHGGGKYKAHIIGPSPTDPVKRPNEIRKHVPPFEIAGPPILPHDSSAPSGGGTELAILKEALASKDKEMERLQASKNDLNPVFEQFMKMFNPNQTQSALAEERRIMEERLRAEREERRLEAEKEREERRREAEALQRQHELRLAEMKEREARMEREARERREEERRLQEEMRREREARETKEHLQMANMQKMQFDMMQQQMTNMVTMIQNTSQMKDTFFTNFIEMQKANSGKSNILDTVSEIKQVAGILGLGGDGDDRDTWEKVLDKTGEMLPGILSSVGKLRGGTPAAQPARVRATVAPGSVAVVEKPPPREMPPATAPAQAQAAQGGQAAAAGETAPPEDIPNPKMMVSFPEATVTLEEHFQHLVQNVDYAIRAGWTPIQIVEGVLEKSDEQVQTIVASTEFDQIVNVIREMAPPKWRVNSLDGKKKLREIHMLYMKKHGTPKAEASAPVAPVKKKKVVKS